MWQPVLSAPVTRLLVVHPLVFSTHCLFLIVTGLPPSQGNTTILTVVDRFSKNVPSYPLLRRQETPCCTMCSCMAHPLVSSGPRPGIRGRQTACGFLLRRTGLNRGSGYPPEIPQIYHIILPFEAD